MSMFSGGDVKFDNVAMEKLLRSPTGAVGRHLNTIAVKIEVGAKAMVGVRTGKMRRSFRRQHRRHPLGQEVVVSNTDRAAYMHHEGTKRHVITPDSGRVLRFKIGGRVVYARKVNHPGTRPVKYLTVPMRRVVGR